MLQVQRPEPHQPKLTTRWPATLKKSQVCYTILYLCYDGVVLRTPANLIVVDTLQDSLISNTTPTLERFQETDYASWSDWLDFDTSITHQPLPFIASPAEPASEARPSFSEPTSAPITWPAEATSITPNSPCHEVPNQPSMLSYMQIFDSSMRPKPRQPRKPKTSSSLVNPRRHERTSRPCQKHKRGKRKVRHLSSTSTKHRLINIPVHLPPSNNTRALRGCSTTQSQHLRKFG
jgi:hypothetical protein